jgi:nitrite reductase/ring-hydroxylating ferredoxin subunit
MTTTVTDGFARAASLTDLPPGKLLGVTLDGDRVCLARVDDDVFALEDRCTHALFPLSRGNLLPSGAIECPWHGAQFDARTGAACRGPAAADARTYDVLLHDGEIHVKLRR